ncbi:MAG: hypothetical protein IPG39_23280 [Bacteroidetes bacterium]|nr:hypothetical protein [Bacteroidota bacterium]
MKLKVAVRDFLTFSTMLFSSLSLAVAEGSDTTETRFIRFQYGFTGSFLHLQNWKGNALSSYSLGATSEYYSMEKIHSGEQLISVRQETSFTRFPDSVWVKAADRLEVQLIASSQSNRLNHTWTLLGSTALFTGFDYFTDPESGELYKKSNSTFLLPADLEAGYGVGVQLPANGFLNFSVATIRIRTEFGKNFEDEHPLIKLKRGFIAVDYGFAMQGYYFFNPVKDSDVALNSRIFVNGFNRNEVQGEFSIKATYKIWKQLYFKGEMMLLYDPAASYSLQWKNELLIGVIFKTKKN